MELLQKKHLIFFILVFLFFSCGKYSYHSQATVNDSKVILKLKPYSTVPTGKLEEYKKFIGLQISLGFLKNHNKNLLIENLSSLPNELVPFIVKKDDKYVLPISDKSYKVASSEWKDAMEMFLLPDFGGVTAYNDVSVDIRSSSIELQEITKRFIPQLTPSAHYVEVSRFLSPFVKKYENQLIREDGPNCFHSALAAVNHGWDNPRFVDEKEFEYYLKKNFKPIENLEQIGDIVVLVNKEGVIEHAATFVGVAQINGQLKHIVFTKNGRVSGRYLYMDLETLMSNSFLFEGCCAYKYRSIKNVSDPNIIKI